MTTTIERSVDYICAARVDDSAVETLRAVHRWVWDAVQFRTDIELFGVKQRTTSPADTLDIGMGDCEDFASVCRTLAVLCGVPDADLHLMLCSVNGAESHCVLLYRDGDLVLDNQLQDLRPLRRRYDLADLRELDKDSFPRLAGEPDQGLRLLA